MAKIEDLIAQISDERLRAAVAAEVKSLKRTKRFGLVFEEHLPETVRLPLLPVLPGELVALKHETGNQLWRVKTVAKHVARCEKSTEGPGTAAVTEHPIQELVVVRNFGDAIYPALIPVDRVERAGPDKPWHVLINADNFHALQLLLYAYEGKIDVIYIDPPYNSGARDWKYNNDYIDKTDSFRHSKWLSMMKKRLLLSKRLLRPDGVLIVTIDENEIFHLGVLLEQVFDNYLRHTVTVVINPKGTGKINFGRTEEHALFCVPNNGMPVINGNHLADLATALEEEEEEPEDAAAEAPEDDEAEATPSEEPDLDSWDRPFPPDEADEWELRHARRRGKESSYRHQRPNQFYPIYIDEGARKVAEIGDSLPLEGEPVFRKKRGTTPVWPIDKEGNHRCWRFIPASMRRIHEQGRLVVGKYNQKTKQWTLNIWEPKNKQKKVKTVWWNPRHDAGTHGTTLLHHLLGRRNAFPFPKSLYAVRDALLAVVAQRPNALVLDFFAGSGTTAHAVALINAQLGGARRSILVTNNEPGEKTAKRLQAAGLFPGDPDYEAQGICESVTWPRCKHAFNGRRADGTLLSGRYVGIGNNGKDLKLSDGFSENIEYFRLDFLDPAEVARGDAFQAILPILWMIAGCVGPREDSKGSQAWFIPKHSPFAVLLREKEFRAFREKLSQRKDVNWAFLVTDSEENFAAMRRKLGSRVQCLQLYKSYLETFRLNTDETLAGKS